MVNESRYRVKFLVLDKFTRELNSACGKNSSEEANCKVKKLR